MGTKEVIRTPGHEHDGDVSLRLSTVLELRRGGGAVVCQLFVTVPYESPGNIRAKRGAKRTRGPVPRLQYSAVISAERILTLHHS
jgi:hypothetical protein